MTFDIKGWYSVDLLYCVNLSINFCLTFENVDTSYKDRKQKIRNLRMSEENGENVADSKQFQCTVDGCNRSYKTKGNLKTHMKIHSGEFSFYCDYEGCEKGFVSAYSFKVHYRHHTGNVYICCLIQ